MNERSILQPKSWTSPPISPLSRGVLQRKCACGGAAELTGECAECQSSRLTGKPLQTKLRVNQPGDDHEQEADRVAEQVMRMPDSTLDSKIFKPLTVPVAQRRTTDNDGGPMAVPAIVQEALASPGQPLDATSRVFFEPRFGHDFSRVRVHADSIAAASARAVNALAYTVGSEMVFGTGQYSSESTEGKKLLAHELTHVVQQHGQGADTALRRKPQDKCPDARSPEPDYRTLARQINEGIEYIWGTDEEKIYRALRVLERDPGRICSLEELYLGEYKRTLLEDIEGDFSDEELEYALQLLNKGKRGSAQRVQAVPITYSGYLADARRLYEAGPGQMGTDEEAIFAVLTSLASKPGMNILIRTYENEYKHTLREMIVDEMDDSERDYALELLAMTAEKSAVKEEESSLEASRENPAVAKWVGEAYDKLYKKDTGFGVWWERDTNGKARWDERYWAFENEGKYREGRAVSADLRLILKPDVAPHEAVDALFGEQHRWTLDCGQFVQVARLYVQRKLLPDDDAFDAWAGNNLELRTHAPETFRLALFIRAHEEGIPLDLWKTHPTGRVDPISEARMLEMAPAGSRIRWTSSWAKKAAEVGQDVLGSRVTRTGWFAFQNENAVKLGPDLYGAHGIGAVSAQEIVEEMIESTRSALQAVAYFPTDLPSNASDEQIRERIYVDNVEYFRWEG